MTATDANNLSVSSKPLHHGPAPLWVIFGLAMGPAIALGLARFAYALLLPAMRADLGWSFADAGAMNTANAAGYLVGALVAAPIGRRFGDRMVFAAGLVLTSLAVTASGMTGNFTGLLVLRLLAGFTGALAFVMGAGLTSLAAASRAASQSATYLGIYFAGAGIGVTASALAVPPILPMGWRTGWLMLGALSLLATFYGCLVLRRTPTHIYGAKHERGHWSPWFMARVLLAYAFFGAGYIAYATFIIAYLRSQEGFSDASVTAFWTILGVASVAAAFAWGPILGRLRHGWGTASTIGIMTVGTALPVLWPTPTGAFLSALLFGGSFLAVLAAVTSFARRCLKSHAWTAAIAALTIAFGIGQCIGPVLSGALSDGPDGVRAGLWLSVGILTVGAIVGAFQRDLKEEC
jgi:predicted MFS family arabinose efflux permease